MKKEEMINQIIGLYDEDTKLKYELEAVIKELKAVNKELEAVKEQELHKKDIIPNLNDMDLKTMEFGKKSILKKSLYSWNEYCKNISFNDWIDKKLSKIPDFMSKNIFIKYFSIELKEMYEKEKNEYLAKQKEEE